MELTEFALVAFGVKILVDIVRRYLPNLDATVTNIVAFALGYAATYVPQVGTFTTWGTRANGAIAIGGIASVFAEVTKTLRAVQVSKAVAKEDLR